MKIALIFNKENPATTGCYYERELIKKSFDITHFWTQDADNIPPTFDLYLRIDHGDYKYDIPENLHPSVFYVIDTHLKKPYKKIKNQVKHYDLLFCCHKDGAKKLKRDTKKDAIWLPVACDPDIHKKLNIPKKYDIGFVGTEGKKSKRKDYLDLFKKKYPNSFIGRTNYDKMNEVYSASKIGFNYSINNDVNMRMFEIMSCGALLLTNRIDKKSGIYDIFDEGKHIHTYRSKKQLLKLIDYYLENDIERKHKAGYGYSHVIGDHTYSHRVDFMLKCIKERLTPQYNLNL